MKKVKNNGKVVIAVDTTAAPAAAAKPIIQRYNPTLFPVIYELPRLTVIQDSFQRQS